MGPRPKPVAILEATGAYKKNPQRRRDTPKPPPGKPRRPAHLTGYGKREWQRMSKMLAAMGLFESCDGRALELYCESYNDWRLAKDQVNKTGLAIVRKDANGNKIVLRNPFFTVKNQAADRCFKLLCEFGLTPSSRARVQFTPQDKADPIKLWMTGCGDLPHDEA